MAEQDYLAPPVFNGYCSDGTIRSTRDFLPAHFLLMINSYSLLCEKGPNPYESDIFEAGGHKWNLCFYPKGNHQSGGDGHISLYLKLADTKSLPRGCWEVNANFTFFVFDQHCEKYLSIQDGSVRRFHRTKTEWGVPQLLSLDIFNDVSKGYLVNDCCVFGVEIFVLKHTGRMDCLSMVKKPFSNTSSWKIKQVSTLDKAFDRLGAFLCYSQNGPITSYQKLYSEYDSSVKNQLDIKSNLEYTGTIRSTRDLQPTHLLFKIDSYSSLCETGAEKYESGIFKAGGHKWKLCFYPKGNGKSGGNNHISLHLKVADTKSLPYGWEVNAKFTFFVFDQLRDNYLTVQDGTIKRFHETRAEWGVPQLLPIDIFNDVSKGYLVDDCCVFGVEVFVLKHTGRIECLSMLKIRSNNIYTWNIKNFSAYEFNRYFLKAFIVKGIRWELCVYPKGDRVSRGEELSVFLCKSKLNSREVECAEFILRVKNQVDNKSNLERTVTTPFGASSWNGWGFDRMIPLKDLQDTSKGYLLNDTLILEVEILTLSMKNFSLAYGC